MSLVLLDTHAWVWSLTTPEKLTQTARAAIAGAYGVYVSPISTFEITQKVRIGKWPEMDGKVHLLVSEGQAIPAPLTMEGASLAGDMSWTHRDPFDRIIAATAIDLGYQLVSKDQAFDDIRHQAWKGRLWGDELPEQDGLL